MNLISILDYKHFNINSLVIQSKLPETGRNSLKYH